MPAPTEGASIFARKKSANLHVEVLNEPVQVALVEDMDSTITLMCEAVGDRDIAQDHALAHALDDEGIGVPLLGLEPVSLTGVQLVHRLDEAGDADVAVGVSRNGDDLFGVQKVVDLLMTALQLLAEIAVITPLVALGILNDDPSGEVVVDAANLDGVRHRCHGARNRFKPASALIQAVQQLNKLLGSQTLFFHFSYLLGISPYKICKTSDVTGYLLKCYITYYYTIFTYFF